MENSKIGRIKKAAGITAKVLNVLRIVAIVTIVLCVVSGIMAMIVKNDGSNSVRMGRFVFIGNVSDPKSPVREWLNITDPNVAAGIDSFIVAAMAALMLAVICILRTTFREIEKSDTPFREEVLKRIRIAGILITVIAVNYSVGVAAMAALTAWCVYCVFDYGIELQKNEDETL